MVNQVARESPRVAKPTRMAGGLLWKARVVPARGNERINSRPNCLISKYLNLNNCQVQNAKMVRKK